MFSRMGQPPRKHRDRHELTRWVMDGATSPPSYRPGPEDQEAARGPRVIGRLTIGRSGLSIADEYSRPGTRAAGRPIADLLRHATRLFACPASRRTFVGNDRLGKGVSPDVRHVRTSTPEGRAALSTGAMNPSPVAATNVRRHPPGERRPSARPHDRDTARARGPPSVARRTRRSTPPEETPRRGTGECGLMLYQLSYTRLAPRAGGRTRDRQIMS